MTLVSVVLPSYRHARFVGEALASVYRQTHPGLELILVDDKSPDATFEIAEKLLASPEYQKRFRRIVCRRNSENLGAHNTINVGLSLARGQWISLLNSDDVYHERRIARLLEHAAEKRANFVFSSLRFMHGRGEIPLHDRLTIKRIGEAQANAWRFPSLRDALFHFNFCATTGNMMFEQTVARQLGGFADLKYCHDWDFIMRAVERYVLSYLPEKLYSYRLHDANSFKALESVARQESEFVARGVRQRTTDRPRDDLAWQYGCLGLLASWLGYR
jgi:glycosyltransferase involved in cell wall biosynthesis